MKLTFPTEIRSPANPGQMAGLTQIESIATHDPVRIRTSKDFAAHRMKKTLLVVLVCLNSASAATVIADYRADFQGSTATTGWTYQHSTSLGDATNFNDMTVWSSTQNRYQQSSTPVFPLLASDRGHPGSETVGSDNFAIAGYTIQSGDPQTVAYTLEDGASFGLQQIDSLGNGTSWAVYVNDSLIDSGVLAAGGSHSFNGLSLGTLTTGDTVYVALGNNGNANNDATFIDYSIQAVPEPSAALLGGVAVLLLLRRRRPTM